MIQFKSPTRFDWIIYFITLTILHVPAIINFYDNDGANNAFLKFCESLMNGHLYLPEMANYDDMISFEGKHYLPYPPFPSAILLPLFAVFGYAVNTVFVALVLSCVNLVLLHRIFVVINLHEKYFPWLIGAFFCGTGYWFALFTSHHVYSFAHITAVTLQLIIIHELLTKRRWWLVGLAIGCGFMTRQFTIIYLLFAIGCLLHFEFSLAWKFRLQHLMVMCSCVGLFLLLTFGYNYVRFGNPFDPGYRYIEYLGILNSRVHEYGVFSARYFLFNFYSLFLKGFNVEFSGPSYMNLKGMDLWGSSVLSASPFVVASLKTGLPVGLRLPAWITIGAIVLGTMFYHNNGFHQVNTMRFSLDFMPLLFLLIAYGAKHLPFWLIKVAVSYAVLLNVISFAIHYVSQH